MKKALVIIGAAEYNRGSEILLIGILDILIEFGDYKSDISAFALPIRWEEENSELYSKFIPRETPYSTLWYKICNNVGIRLAKRTLGGQLTTWFSRQALCQAFREYDLIVFVGADNFDYMSNRPNELNSLISLAKKTSKARLALVDCSISKQNIDKFFIHNIREVDLITARDSLSAQNIGEYVPEVLLHADPAFKVPPKKCDKYIGEGERYIGINVSPLVCEINEKVKDNIICLIRWILQHTEEIVLLIPHVMKGCDYQVLSLIKEKFLQDKRVVLLEEDKYTARELKYIISCSDAFVGARTHAMIAAYSSCVPALGIGYSIKSDGIAKDILGDDNYCIQASNILSERCILDLFVRLWENREEIKAYMEKTIPDYINNTLRKLGEIL